MNGTSSVVLLATGWQLPHVRPFPPKVSRKKMSAPAQISLLTKPAMTRGSCMQAVSRCCAVNALWTSATLSTSPSPSATGPEQPNETPPTPKHDTMPNNLLADCRIMDCSVFTRARANPFAPFDFEIPREETLRAGEDC